MELIQALGWFFSGAVVISIAAVGARLIRRSRPWQRIREKRLQAILMQEQSPLLQSLPSVPVFGELTVSEYQSLRAEILKHLEFRFLFTNLVVVSAGIFLALGCKITVKIYQRALYRYISSGWYINLIVDMQIGKFC